MRRPKHDTCNGDQDNVRGLTIIAYFVYVCLFVSCFFFCPSGKKKENISRQDIKWGELLSDFCST